MLLCALTRARRINGKTVRFRAAAARAEYREVFLSSKLIRF
jgi:hypothetical protein